MKTHFKVDTGADGNLLPLGGFFKHFPEANLNDLAKTVDPHTTLYAYNNTEIKQLGFCELLVEYKSNRKICELIFQPQSWEYMTLKVPFPIIEL